MRLSAVPLLLFAVLVGVGSMLRLFIALIALTGTSVGIDWPIEPQTMSHQIDGDYGHSNVPWMDVSPTNFNGNFHTGIDLFLPEGTGSDDVPVYAIESGVITEIISTIPR